MSDEYEISNLVGGPVGGNRLGRRLARAAGAVAMVLVPLVMHATPASAAGATNLRLQMTASPDTWLALQIFASVNLVGSSATSSRLSPVGPSELPRSTDWGLRLKGTKPRDVNDVDPMTFQSLGQKGPATLPQRWSRCAADHARSAGAGAVVPLLRPPHGPCRPRPYYLLD